MARHTTQEFVAFLTDIIVRYPDEQEIRIILDNLSAHKTQRVQDFLTLHPNVNLHFTPTYSSWLNQVELWFSTIERDPIYRGVFTSVNDLSRRIMTYIRNEDPQPIKWKYVDPKRPLNVHVLQSTSQTNLTRLASSRTGSSDLDPRASCSWSRWRIL